MVYQDKMFSAFLNSLRILEIDKLRQNVLIFCNRLTELILSYLFLKPNFARAKKKKSIKKKFLKPKNNILHNIVEIACNNFC